MMLFLFGLPCGMLAGLTGIAAGVVAQPLLRFLLGLRGSRLVGSALAVTFFAALSAVLSYSQHRFIDWGYAVYFVIGQTVGAVVAQRFVKRFPQVSGLNWLWASVVVAIGLAMCVQGAGGYQLWRHHLVHLEDGLGEAILYMTVVPVLTGFASGVMRLGGVLTVPAAMYALGAAAPVAQGIAIVVLLIASLPAVLAHGARRDLEPASATWMSLGAIFGGLVGAFYAVSPGLTWAHLTLIYGIALMLIGLSLLWRTPDAG